MKQEKVMNLQNRVALFDTLASMDVQHRGEALRDLLGTIFPTPESPPMTTRQLSTALVGEALTGPASNWLLKSYLPGYKAPLEWGSSRYKKDQKWVKLMFAHPEVAKDRLAMIERLDPQLAAAFKEKHHTSREQKRRDDSGLAALEEYKKVWAQSRQKPTPETT